MSTIVVYYVPNTQSSLAVITATGKSACSYSVCIQDYDAATCAAEASSSSKTVYDQRDGNSYTVRYINGNCWMTQNLRFSKTQLTSELTNIDVDKNITWYDLTSSTGKSTYDYAAYHNSGNTTNGYWYNYAGASAMTITGLDNADDTVYDICPKNWHLPTITETQTIADYTSTYVSPFNPSTGGRYNNGGIMFSYTGSWWGSESKGGTDGYKDARSVMRYESGTLGESSYWEPRTTGDYVRCIRTT